MSNWTSIWEASSCQDKVRPKNMQSFICCTLINFIFFSVNPALGDATSTEAYLKLTDEMRNIVDRNQKNFDSVRWIHGTVKIVSTNSYKDKGSRVKEQTEEIWYDGSHSRTDILESKFIGKETDPLLVEEDSRGGKITFEPMPIGYTEIESIESKMLYHPSMQTVNISPPEQDARRYLRSIGLMDYQTITGSTLKEVVLRCAEKDYYFTVKSETVDGDDCLLLEYDNAKYDITRKIWIVPSKGYCIKKMQLQQKGIVHEEYTTTLKEYLPGIWWFDSVKAKTLGGGEEINPDRILELSVKSLTLNEPIDRKTFTLAGTNIPSGTRVHDEITGITYNYVNIPLPSTLTGKALPDMKQLAIGSDPNETKGRMLLVCFFDMNQRPSRNCATALANPAEQLKQKGVIIVAVQASKVERNILDEYVKKYNIPFPVGMIQSDDEKTRFAWGVRSLPWLILTDKAHIVTAEGFGLNELEDRIKAASQ